MKNRSGLLFRKWVSDKPLLLVKYNQKFFGNNYKPKKLGLSNAVNQVVNNFILIYACVVGNLV